MNIFINTIYLDDFAPRWGYEKRFPLIYFWLKDYYYQRSPDNFARVNNWLYSDETTLLREDTKTQKQLFENPPDIVGLSLYLWNAETLLDNAKWIKENFPNCTIVAAGPNADSRKPFMQEHTYIDAVVLGPGAETFKRIVDAKLDGKPIQDIAGVNYWNGTEVVSNEPVPRDQDPLVLDYVNNFREEVTTLLDQYSKKYDSVVVLTMYIQGCPYSCSFCEQGTKLWTKINKRDIQKLYDEIDLIGQYPNVIYEFADANFGIVKEYEDIVDYAIANGNLKFKKPPLAKNQVDFTNHLMDKLIKAGIYQSDMFGALTLQDPNPEIVKLNGRPFSKEYQKIKAFQEVTKDSEHKIGQVEIILGMPGQSWDTLSGSLNELLRQDLLSHFLPYLYLVFPNTVLTSPGTEANIESRRIKVRRERAWIKGFLESEDEPSQISYEWITSTETLKTKELVAVHYYWTLMCHIYGFTGWLKTPVRYLKNYHDIDSLDFVKKFTAHFHPDVWHKLPLSIRLDLEAWDEWFSGKVDLFNRRDNTGKYFLSPRKISQYRFHTDYKDFEKILINVLNELIPQDKYIDDLMLWQRAKLRHFDCDKINITSYNWDDIANKVSDTYWLSDFTFTSEQQDLLQCMLDLEDIHFIPQITYAEPAIQTPLLIKN